MKVRCGLLMQGMRGSFPMVICSRILLQKKGNLSFTHLLTTLHRDWTIITLLQIYESTAGLSPILSLLFSSPISAADVLSQSSKGFINKILVIQPQDDNNELQYTSNKAKQVSGMALCQSKLNVVFFG